MTTPETSTLYAKRPDLILALLATRGMPRDGRIEVIDEITDKLAEEGLCRPRTACRPEFALRGK